MTLTKANILEAIAEQIGYTKKQSVETVETLLELIKRSLESGEDVLVSAFGRKDVHTIIPVTDPARTGPDVAV